MKITLNVSLMHDLFVSTGRDYYSWEGMEALLEYYDEDMEFDAVAINGDCTEYGEGASCSFDALIHDYGYAYPFDDYLADNDTTVDEADRDDYIEALVKRIEKRHFVLHVKNGNYIIFV